MSARILYLIPALGWGGAEQGLVLNLQHLDRDRFRPEVAIFGKETTRAPELLDVGIPVHRLHGGAGPRTLAKVPEVARMLRGFDIVHSSLVWASVVGNLAGALARVKVVEHMVNVDPDGLQAATLSPSVARKTRMVASLNAQIGRMTVDRYVAISRATTEFAPWRWMRDPDRVRVVLRGQDIEGLTSRAAAEPEPAFPDGGPTLITVGRLYPQKGHRYLVAAMPRVLAQHPDAQLLIVGEGPLRVDLERQIHELGLGDSVRLLGARHDAPSLVARSDVFVFPSLWEGQGNAVVQAAVLGRPIVATRIAVMQETFEDEVSALLVAPKDVDELASSLIRVLDDTTLAAGLGVEAGAVARERFDIRATTRALEAAYDELLEGR